MAFMDRDFLLESKTAKVLYHEYADKMPIIDYHCHLDPSEIYNDKRFDSISEAWLGGDHYKWRLMRACGISEELITGGADGWDKFKAFAETLPRAIGSPIYHWAHLELQRYFDCDEVICPDTAKDIWVHCNDKLKNAPDMSVRGIIKKSRVETLATSDDPADDLQWHKKLYEDKSNKTKVLPCWRPGLVLEVANHDFPNYIDRLGKSAETKICNYNELLSVLQKRMVYFNDNGCLVSDHVAETLVYAPATDEDLNQIFTKAMKSEILSSDEVDKFKYNILHFSAKESARLGWVMQFRIGSLRNVNTFMLEKLGANTGYDCSAFTGGTSSLAKLLDSLNRRGSLPKTILFSIDPNDNMALTTLAACFSEQGIKSKVQQGSAWWFNDTLSGMEQQLITFAEQGVLGNFLGMLTDSRSFLSYTRHEYFRRILCNLVGKWADTGKFPNKSDCLGGLIQDICYNNVKNYFGF